MCRICWLVIAVLVLIFLFISLTGFSATIESRFQGDRELAYKVHFNGMHVGWIKWKYLGKGQVYSRPADIVYIDSDAKIFQFLNVQTKEKIFLDCQTHLPLKVERDVVMFGKNELIEEFYDQERGLIKIINSAEKTKEQIITQDKPIQHIMALLYFFPSDVELKPNQWLDFNLPTQKLRMKVLEDRDLTTLDGKTVKTHFLLGRGARKFSLWLDKEERLPLRIEFITMVGKVTICKVAPDSSLSN